MENEQNTTHITFRDQLKVLFRRKRIIIVVFLAMTATVLAGLQLKTPVYESRVTMFIMATKQVDSLYYKNAPEMRPTNMALTQSEMVKSNPVMERVVGKLRLYEMPDDYEKPFATPLKSLLLDVKENAARRKFLSFSEEEQEKIRFRRAVESLKKKTKVEPVRETDLFVVTVTDFDAAMAARLANAVSRSYCIFDLEQQLAELKQKYGDKHLFVMQLKDNLAKMESELTADTLSNIDAIGPASVKIIEQASAAIEPAGKSKKVVLLVTVFMSLMLGFILAFVYDGFDSTIHSGQELEAALKIPLLGYVPRKIPFLGRIAEAAAETLGWLTWIGLGLLAARFLLSSVQTDPENPIVSFIYGSSEPVMAVSGMQYLAEPQGSDGRILVAALIIALVAVPVIWALRRSASTGIRKILVNIAKDKNKYAYAYVNLAEQVYSTLKNSSRKSLLITAPLTGEGTTSVVANIGAILSSRSNRVLIIDANLRKPGVHRVFKLENSLGLAELLAGDCAIDEAIQPVSRLPGQDEERLFVLAAGKSAANSLVLFDSDKIAGVIKQAEEKFDFVLLDSPNLQAFKDAVSISAHVDSVALVVSEGKSRKEIITHVLSLLERKKARLIGGILNNRTFIVPKFLYERA